MKTSFLKDYFHYTRSERNASLVLFTLIVVLYSLPSLYPYILPDKGTYDFSEFQKEIDALLAANAVENKGQGGQEDFRGNQSFERKAEGFYFDPNLASKEDFIRLGLSPRVAATILNYRSKGGRFYQAEDFSRIYILRQEDFERLKPFIQIGEKYRKRSTPLTSRNEEEADLQPKQESENPRKYFPKKEPAAIILDINAATPEEWQQLRGIGPAFARRIVNFREKLGGFSSVQQVGETYGLPDSTFQQIKPALQASPILRNIRVNTATLQELKDHPYLSNFQATAMFNYRQQHGVFTDMNSLKKMLAFKESDWERLEPYIAFE